jgi:ABC-2 type transport system permease protein
MAFRLLLIIVKYSFLSRIEYPRSYIGGIIAQWLVYATQMFMLFLVIWNFGSLGGWTPIEVVFINAIWLMTYAIGASFTFNISRKFPQMAIDGTIDEAFVRPVRSLVYLIASDYNVDYISHFILTSVVLIFCGVQLELTWSVFHWLWFAVMIISGSIINGCMMLICCMPALRTRSQSPVEVFFWQGRSFTQYPISIYPQPIQFIFLTVLPFSFISFYPVQVLLGKQDGLFAGVAMWLSPLVAALLISITFLLWNSFTRRYESAGT